MKNLKRIGLLALLLVPIFFFVFLIQFGSNHFDLPYYGDRLGVDEYGDTLYASVHDSLLVEYKGDVSVYVFFDSLASPTGVTKFNQLSRLKQWYQNKYPLNIVFISDTSFSEKLPFPILPYTSAYKDAFFINGDSIQLEKEVVAVSNLFVLLDQKNRVRGYYNGLDKLETDRLKEEISVLTNK